MFSTLSTVNKVPIKERLMVRNLRDFIDKEKDYAIALIAGMRQVGKTTVLQQLQQYYPGSQILDFSDNVDDCVGKLMEFTDRRRKAPAFTHGDISRQTFPLDFC